MVGSIKTPSGVYISKDLATFTKELAIIINDICPDKNGVLSMKKTLKTVRKKFKINTYSDWDNMKVFIRNRVLETVDNMERWYGM